MLGGDMLDYFKIVGPGGHMLPVASSGVYGAYIRNKSSETGSMHVQARVYTICTWAYGTVNDLLLFPTSLVTYIM